MSDNIGQLKMLSHDGKMRLTDVANTKELLRLIQSVPSPKTEPFKEWYSKHTLLTYNKQLNLL